ncbi:hypothetical protein ESA94_18720 [Lacibacter luteus]|uniref:Uncharacterized protein n=1 Tax=Lacibacter luteus TaxID=2508719 RepID=A0A4Q1CEN6_9BACT|nr:hypothetical protein [Lacibacter luteus]RXK58048.1 hypothetical protein ESA94_18720 [Lacibacter luteus]
MQQFSKITTQKIFLIDGIGALVSACMLGFVLTTFESFFGMPKNILYALSAIALLLSVYSFTNAANKPANPAFRLRIIAIANLFYCFLTFVLVFLFYEEITVYGLLYFLSVGVSTNRNIFTANGWRRLQPLRKEAAYIYVLASIV